MRDKRPVDELSIEELERILAMRKREQRMARAQQSRERGRVAVEAPDVSMTTPVVTTPAPSAEVAVEPTPIAPPVDSEVVAFVDDLHGNTSQADVSKQLTTWGLLAVEVIAVLGLVFVVYQGFTGLASIEDSRRDLQEESNRIQAASQPTATPAPDLAPTALILPGGHVYDASGNHEFNAAEYDVAFEQQNIPENLRPALRQQASANLTFDQPPQITDPIAIEIPRIGIDRASGKGSVSRGADWETLTNGLGWYNNGANLANGLNVVIVGHNDIYGEIFRDLGELEIGDEITIYGNNGQRYTYRVSDEQIVQPTEVSVLNPNSGADLTLITCYPYQVNDRRLIIFAERIS